MKSQEFVSWFGILIVPEGHVLPSNTVFNENQLTLAGAVPSDTKKYM